MLSPSHSDLGARAAAWIRQHYPRRAAGALTELFSIDERTAKRVLAGEASSRLLVLMATRFGDSFQDFVFGPGAPPAMAAPKPLWFTPAAVHEAPGGHGLFARDALGLSAGSAGDHCAYMKRNCGWVAATLTPGHLAVEAHEAANAAALERLRDWLAARTDVIRCVEIDGHRLDSLDAIVEIDRRAGLSRSRDAALSMGWRIERGSLESLTAPHLQEFLVARHQAGSAPGTLPRLLQITGVLPFAALFHRRRDRSTWTLFQGAELGVDPVECIGHEIGERREKLYADNLRQRLEGARREPTLHRLRGPVGGRLFDWDSLATADEPAADGSQLIATVVDIHSKVAA